MTISLGLSCMNACMEPFLKYSETIFKEMLIYIIIFYEMLMICMCHMDDLISEHLVSKLQGRICGILFHHLLKIHNQFISSRKTWGTTWLRKKGTRKGFVNSLSASDAHVWVIWVSIGLGSGLSPTRHKSLAWTDADLFHWLTLRQCMCQWIVTASVQVAACHLSGAGLLSEPVLTH